MKNILGWIRDLGIAIVIAIIILIFLKPIIIQQESMQPNFYENDYVITSRQAYNLFGNPKSGDVIVFKSELIDESGKNKYLIKRIIGLPGDEVEIKEGFVYVNGEKLEEDYIKEQGVSGEMAKMTVPKNEFFAMGDNRGNSRDSRDPAVGTVKKKDIVGKVVIRLYPFNKITVF